MDEESEAILNKLVPELQVKVRERMAKILEKYPNTTFAINDLTKERAKSSKGPACELRWQAHGRIPVDLQLDRPVELEIITV